MWLGPQAGQAHILGLAGMGGIGKTTLATALYNRLLPGFSEAACFLQDVRGHMALHGGSVVDLQRTLLDRLCGCGIAITDEAEGAAGGQKGMAARTCIRLCMSSSFCFLVHAATSVQYKCKHADPVLCYISSTSGVCGMSPLCSLSCEGVLAT